jgi:long-subunit fatty acid transport protein
MAIFLIIHPVSGQNFTPTSLEIANPNPVGSGARAMGQANAFIAVADDATAASWNPGGLTQLERPEFSFALEWLQRRDSTNLNPTTLDKIELQDVNYASLVLPFYLTRHMVFSLNYLKQFRFDRNLSLPLSNGAVDYRFQQEGEFTALSPAFAVDVTPQLALGLTVNFWHDSLTHASNFEKRETTAGMLNFFGQPVSLNSIERNHFEVEEGYSLVLGGIYRLNQAWSFGAVIKPGYQLDLDHERTGTVTLSGSGFNSTQAINEQGDAELEFPWIVGIGTAWRPNDPLTISMDVTWTDWSKYIYTENGLESNPIKSTPPGTSIEKNQDTYTLRLGCEYILILKDYLFPLRGGVGYDPAPSVNHDDYYTINLGVGIQIKERVNLDLGWEYRWGNNVNGDSLASFPTDQDISSQRILLSMICYF